MKRFLTLIILWTAAVTVFAQAPKAASPPPPPQAEKVTPKAPYDSTKGLLVVEKQKNLELQAQQSRQAFQQSIKDMQAQYGDLQKQLDVWVESVRKANGWDEAYTWDATKDEWTRTPKSEKK